MSADATAATRQSGPGVPAPRGKGEMGVDEARRHLADTAGRRRQLAQQKAVLRGHVDRLSEQARVAQEQERPPEYLREILQRRLTVQARLEEAEMRLGRTLREEERLTAHVDRLEADAVRSRPAPGGPSH